MADFSALKALIDSEPANAARTDQQVLDWLNETIQVFVDVAWLDVNMWLVAQGIDRATLTTQATTGTAANKTAAQYILDVITAGQPMAASDARVQATIQASGLTGAQKSALLALATKTVPRYSGLFDNVSLQIVNVARTGGF